MLSGGSPGPASLDPLVKLVWTFTLEWGLREFLSSGSPHHGSLPLTQTPRVTPGDLFCQPPHRGSTGQGSWGGREEIEGLLWRRPWSPGLGRSSLNRCFQ